MNDDLSSLNFIATILASKWTLPVVCTLKNQTRRYHELQKHIPNITQKMLTATLRQLESNGLIKRKVYPTVPPKVEYKLTDQGLEVLAIIDKLDVWVKDNRIISRIRRIR